MGRAQIYGAIAFYLDHQSEIDKHLEETEREFEGNAIPLEQSNPNLWARIQKARAQLIAEGRISRPTDAS